MRSKYIEEEWPPEEPLTLDIHPGSRPNIMEATADFSIFIETILLAPSKDVLDAFSSPVVNELGEESDDSDTEQQDDSGKRKAGAAPVGPHKKATAGTSELRFPVRLRGRETGEGDVLPDPEKGYIEFTDDTYAAFRAVVDIALVGDGIEIKGWKVDGRSRKRPEPWNNSSYY